MSVFCNYRWHLHDILAGVLKAIFSCYQIVIRNYRLAKEQQTLTSFCVPFNFMSINHHCMPLWYIQPCKGLPTDLGTWHACNTLLKSHTDTIQTIRTDFRVSHYHMQQKVKGILAIGQFRIHTSARSSQPPYYNVKPDLTILFSFDQ